MLSIFSKTESKHKTKKETKKETKKTLKKPFKKIEIESKNETRNETEIKTEKNSVIELTRMNYFNYINKINESKYDTFIIFLCKDLVSQLKELEKILQIKIPQTIINSFKGKKEEINDFYVGDKNIILVGFKHNHMCNEKNMYESASILGKKLNDTDKNYLVIINNLTNTEITSIISGFMYGIYKFTKYNKTKLKTPYIDFYDNDIDDDDNKTEKLIKETIKINEIQCEIRDLVNEPVNILNSITFLNHIQNSLSSSPSSLSSSSTTTKSKNIKITVLDEKELKKQGLNLILAVNKGSKNPPMMCIIEYNGLGSDKSIEKSNENICLVGKGVMFDTGGLNLKTGDMYDMKEDMAGSAVVYGVIKTLAELKVKKNVIGILPIVENNIDGDSIHPGDVIKSYSGQTVEILNTDAEGRLILADAMSYSKKYNPQILIDVATLTGQEADIFDNLASAVFGNDKELIETIIKCGLKENEKFWQLPLWDETIESMESTTADLRNMNEGYGDTISAAGFLSKFVPNHNNSKKIKWIHLDTAGVSYYLTDSKTRFSGATGETFRTLVKYLRNF